MMRPSSSFKLLLISSAALLATACGGGSDSPAPGAPNPPVTPPVIAPPVVPPVVVPPVVEGPSARSANAIIYGLSDYSVPEGTNVPVTTMGHMKYLFDQVAEKGLLLEIALGDGEPPVKVLDPATGDQFLPGKLALGFAHILIDMKDKGDPQYAKYLDVYKTTTKAMMAKNGNNWVYTNNSFGEYYYLLALNKFQDKGMVNEVFDADLLVTLKERLNYKDLFTGDPALYQLNTVSNYYAVAYGIAGLRQRLGWENIPANARDDILAKLLNHYRTRSTEGFSDETDGNGRFDRYSVLLIGEVVERSIEMGNEAAITPELKGWLRKSVDLILPQMNTDGVGFLYGRSIGPYGDTAFVEILTAAAKMGVLTPKEMDVAYAFVQASMNRFMNFWYDSESKSVNLWVKGRGTDSYRSTRRAMGENLSLSHQLLYVNERWNELGYKGKAPMAKADLQAYLDSTQKRVTVTKYDTRQDGYVRTIVTVRDGKRSFNLNLVNGNQDSNYWRTNPYFPIPFSNNIVSGTADNTYPQLTPRLVIGSSNPNFAPVTYYRNLVVNEDPGTNTVTVTYENNEMENVSNAPAKNTNIASKTTYTFAPGSVSRRDTFTAKAAVTVNLVQSDFGSYSDMVGATSTPAAPWVATYAAGDVTEYSTTGYDICTLAPFGTVANSKSPVGKLLSNYSCKTSGPVAWAKDSVREFGWTMKYKP